MARLRSTPRGIALAAVLVAFAAGVVAIIATGASTAHLGTLLVGCTALGTILATALDRTTSGRTRRRR